MLDLRKVFGMMVTYDDQLLVSQNKPFEVITELYPRGSICNSYSPQSGLDIPQKPDYHSKQPEALRTRDPPVLACCDSLAGPSPIHVVSRTYIIFRE